MYLRKNYGTTKTIQTEKIPGSNQEQNNAGGFSWKIDEWQQLQRFLILGTESGTYYVNERKLTTDNINSLLQCINEDGIRTVKIIEAVSIGGLAAKNDAALFALAACAGTGNDITRKAALIALPQVARIGTHLMHFAAYVQEFRGWGRGLRTAIGDWYSNKEPDKLAYQLVKYQSRDKWSNRDLLRLSHPKPPTSRHDALYKWVTKGEIKYDAVESIIIGYTKLQEAKTEKDAADLVAKYNLPMETVPTQFKKSPAVWQAALPHLGLTAIIRNLGNMSSYGLLKQGHFETINIITKQLNRENIHKSRVHPIAILTALLTYKSGHGFRGSNNWNVVPDVVDALDNAFYLAFDNIIPTNKPIVLALDVSGSMSNGEVAGISGLTPRVAAAALAMVTYKTEKMVSIISFQDKIVPLDISRQKSLADVVESTENLPFGHTDCAQPMIWALANNVKAEAFVILTDSETWCGKMHPIQALNEYRRKMNIPAKLIVVGMVSNGFTIAAPNDSGMLDVVGMSTDTPAIINNFISGDI